MTDTATTLDYAADLLEFRYGWCQNSDWAFDSNNPEWGSICVGGAIRRAAGRGDRYRTNQARWAFAGYCNQNNVSPWMVVELINDHDIKDRDHAVDLLRRAAKYERENPTERDGSGDE